MIPAVLIVLACGMLALGYYLGIFTGAPYVPSDPARVRRMLELAQMRPGERLVDLGCGDGRILIEAARRGAFAVGYEINPLLVRRARRAIAEAGVSDRAQVICGNFWSADLAGFDIVTAYGVSSVMRGLEKRIREGRLRARIVSNGFPFPTLPARQEGHLFVYGP